MPVMSTSSTVNGNGIEADEFLPVTIQEKDTTAAKDRAPPRLHALTHGGAKAPFISDPGYNPSLFMKFEFFRYSSILSQFAGVGIVLCYLYGGVDGGQFMELRSKDTSQLYVVDWYVYLPLLYTSLVWAVVGCLTWFGGDVDETRFALRTNYGRALTFLACTDFVAAVLLGLGTRKEIHYMQALVGLMMLLGTTCAFALLEETMSCLRQKETADYRGLVGGGVSGLKSVEAELMLSAYQKAKAVAAIQHRPLA